MPVDVASHSLLHRGCDLSFPLASPNAGQVAAPAAIALRSKDRNIFTQVPPSGKPKAPLRRATGPPGLDQTAMRPAASGNPKLLTVSNRELARAEMISDGGLFALLGMTDQASRLRVSVSQTETVLNGTLLILARHILAPNPGKSGTNQVEALHISATDATIRHLLARIKVKFDRIRRSRPVVPTAPALRHLNPTDRRG
ncbi:hypothetical protein [Cribrihabitans marinus]|uniref:hypothetical protein n=1 Tax=Cribrihabitans marinus TaxID=1227549 RepID=UPI00115F8299|nr:hypothetical protein [Cribrihabitans marinus]GGH19260.1 hypothetical protein GCM10010973_02520 [Cribrihabitans marinus]